MPALLAYIFFYPTLWWNLAMARISKRRRWWDWVDDSVLIGALPMRRHVSALRGEGIGAVINTCREYAGPLDAYHEHGIEQLHLPTIDFTPPSPEHLREGVAFIQRHAAAGRKVYVHCKAGRGRSATLVICYLISKGLSPEEAQAALLKVRPHVKSNLAGLKVVRDFAEERQNIHHKDTKAQR